MINGYSRDDVVLRNVPKYLKCSFLWKVVLMWSNMERVSRVLHVAGRFPSRSL